MVTWSDRTNGRTYERTRQMDSPKTCLCRRCRMAIFYIKFPANNCLCIVIRCKSTSAVHTWIVTTNQRQQQQQQSSTINAVKTAAPTFNLHEVMISVSSFHHTNQSTTAISADISTSCSEHVCRSFLSSGLNVCWPRRTRPSGESRWVWDGTERQMDRRTPNRYITLSATDAASIITAC